MAAKRREFVDLKSEIKPGAVTRIKAYRAQDLHQNLVQLSDFKSALFRTYHDLDHNHTLQMAAALSYYFVMALFPCLIFLSAIVTYLPVPNLFDKTIELMGHFIPHDSMGIVRQVLHDVVTPNRGA